MREKHFWQECLQPWQEALREVIKIDNVISKSILVDFLKSRRGSRYSKPNQREIELSRRFMVFCLGILFVFVTIVSGGWDQSMNIKLLFGAVGTTAMALSVIIFTMLSWKKQSLKELKRQNNILLVLVLVSAIFTIYNYINALGTLQAATDIEILFGIVLGIINRFL